VSYGFDDAAEERLYWCLNNSIDLDAQGRVKPKQQTMKPSEWAEMAMAQKRMNTQVPIDTRFASEGDYFVRPPPPLSPTTVLIELRPAETRQDVRSTRI
jgi:hypothetical protein